MSFEMGYEHQTWVSLMELAYIMGCYDWEEEDEEE